jgi:glycerol transport system ATP-binding protein
MRLELDRIHLQTHRISRLREISCELQGFQTLLGPTGSGKTRLLRILAGLDAPTEGRLLRDGQDITGLDVRSRNVAMVYQQFVNYPSLTVFENIASPLRVRKAAGDQVRQRVHELAERLGLTDLLDRLPQELSGGQQQRTAIARALAKDADLILLDEPLANLDYKLREQLRTDLKHLFHETEAVVVYATTEPSEALTLGAETLLLHEGQLLAHGPCHSLYQAPPDLDAARIFSDPPVNVLPAEIASDSLRIGSTALPLPPHGQGLPTGPCLAGIRPHHLHIHAAPGRVAIPVTVALSEITGSSTRIHGRLDSHDLISVHQGVHPLELETVQDLHIDPTRILLFAEDGRLSAAPEGFHGAS